MFSVVQAKITKNNLEKLIMMSSISGHGRQPSMILVFSKCKKKSALNFSDLDIENSLGGGTLAKFRSSLYPRCAPATPFLC
jgi:hypothetical protein